MIRTEEIRSKNSTTAKSRANTETLLRRNRVIAAPRPYPEILAVVGDDLNGPEMPVRLEVCRLVGDGILGSQLILNLGKRIGHIANLERKKCAPAGRVGNPLQHLVARPLGPADVGADGIHNRFRALRHLN